MGREARYRQAQRASGGQETTSAVRRPPAPGMPLAELLTVSDQTDETGRLLLEDSAPEPAVRAAVDAGIAMLTEACPYKDTPSRLGGAMNVSAYEALRHDTAAVLNGFSWLTTQYLARDPSRSGTVQGLYDTSYLGITLPLVLFYQAQNPVPPHGSLPSYVASIFKAARGLFSASVDLLNKRGPTAAVAAAEVVRFAEDEGHLVRQETGRVCAAPTRLIERTIAVLLTGEGADPHQSPLAEVLDFALLWEFYSLQDSFNRSLSAYSYRLDELLRTANAANPRELFALRVQDGGKTRSFGSITESLLRQANETQVGLNRLLGRARNAPPVLFEHLLALL